MTGYLIRRVLQAVVVVILVSIIVFILLHLLPGGPARAILGPRATATAIKAFNHEQGYDKPIVVQYFSWANKVLHGNLGFSYKLNQSVASLLGERLPKTLILMLISTLVALIVALPLGIMQAVRRNSAVDYTVTGLAFIFYAAPAYFLGLVLILVFAVSLSILPPQAPQGGLTDVLTQPQALILPVITLALLIIAMFSRYMRSATMDNLTEDYVRTARAKGAGERRILLRHVLRNALIPIVTLLGIYLPQMFVGALITESVFNYPGMGYLFWQGAQQNDFPLLLGVALVTSFATVAGSLLADIAYAVLDPRVRYVRS